MALAGVIVVIVDRVIVPIKCARKIGDWASFLTHRQSTYGLLTINTAKPQAARPSERAYFMFRSECWGGVLGVKFSSLCIFLWQFYKTLHNCNI